MPELRSDTAQCPKKAKPAPNRPPSERIGAHSRTPVDGPAGSRRPADILAGLPAHVMDELVEDMAEAVVAILLDRETAETSDSDNESSHLRQI